MWQICVKVSHISCCLIGSPVDSQHSISRLTTIIKFRDIFFAQREPTAFLFCTNSQILKLLMCQDTKTYNNIPCICLRNWCQFLISILRNLSSVEKFFLKKQRKCKTFLAAYCYKRFCVLNCYCFYSAKVPKKYINF